MEHHLNTQYHVTQPTLRRPPRLIALTAAVALIGVFVSIVALRTWKSSGDLTAASYAMAALMYVVTPAGISYRLFNNQFKNTAR